MERPKEIVRRGCDALSYLYRGDAEEPELYAIWLAQLQERVPAGGAVLESLVSTSASCRSSALAASSRRQDSSAPTPPRSAFRVPRLTRSSICTRSSTCRWTRNHHCWAGSAAGCDLEDSGHHRTLGVDRDRGSLAGWGGSDVVEPRRRSDLPRLDRAGWPVGCRTGGHLRG
jgi:hypothetical protein